MSEQYEFHYSVTTLLHVSHMGTKQGCMNLIMVVAGLERCYTGLQIRCPRTVYVSYTHVHKLAQNSNLYQCLPSQIWILSEFVRMRIWHIYSTRTTDVQTGVHVSHMGTKQGCMNLIMVVAGLQRCYMLVTWGQSRGVWISLWWWLGCYMLVTAGVFQIPMHCSSCHKY